MKIAEANETFMKIFERMHTAGLLDRESVRTLASAWHAESERAGSDVTHGLLRMVTGAIKLSPAELNLHMGDVGRVDFDTAVAGRPVCVSLHRRGQAQPGFVSTPMPLCCVGGSSGLSMGRGERPGKACGGPSQDAVLRARLPECMCTRFLDDDSRMVVIVAATRKGLLVTTNSVANDSFCSATKITALMHRHHVLPMHVLASIISPPDRHLLYEAEVSMLCSQIRPYTAIVKRNRQCQLYFLQARAMQLSGAPEACGPATLLTLEPCPSSRYLNAQPGDWQTVVEVHREEPESLVNGEGPGVINSHRASLPMACLAVPPLGTTYQRTGLWSYHLPYARPLPPLYSDHTSHHCLDDNRRQEIESSSADIMSGYPSLSNIVPGLVSYAIHSYSSVGLPVLVANGIQGCSDEALRLFDIKTSDLARPVRDGPDGCSSGPSGGTDLTQ